MSAREFVMPEFRMPACWRHFFKGHRWWCRACDRETAEQFREVCEAYWPIAHLGRVASPVDVGAPDPKAKT